MHMDSWSKYGKGVISVIRLVWVRVSQQGKIEFTVREDMERRVRIVLKRRALLQMREKVHLREGAFINCGQSASIKIGAHTSIGRNSIVAAHDHISIGQYCDIAPNVCIYDHDHDFTHPDGMKAERYLETPVFIGNNVWIGAGTVILRGSVIGDNAVIGAGTVIKGRIEADTVVYCKNEIIKKSYRKIGD